ncbi:MAG: hypothetical protein IJX93_00790 [Clostridia bacterium]|nr:hypothetical protein [Clostridia bacterium]MBQ8512359.1 hypothetical protein [Clostridia bacterium]
MKNNSLETASEKAQNRYIFCCIALILYTMPCLSCLMLPILTEGMTFPNIAAVSVVLLGIAGGLIGINRFKAKRGRGIVILTAAVLLVLHFIAAFLIGTWYIIMAPEFVLLILLIAWSDVVEKH